MEKKEIMIESDTDLWLNTSQFKCITTNSVIKANGHLVMGRGIALEASIKYPKLSFELGCLVKHYGNNPFIMFNYNIISFPTKHHWKDNSDINLIERSAKIISAFAKIYDIKSISLPRPGCGNGHLRWGDVAPILEKYFDDRFIVHSKVQKFV